MIAAMSRKTLGGHTMKKQNVPRRQIKETEWRVRLLSSDSSVTNVALSPQTHESFVTFNEWQPALFLHSKIANVACHLCQQKYGIDIKKKGICILETNASSSKAWFVTLQGLPPSHKNVSLICATIWIAKPADESARLIFAEGSEFETSKFRSLNLEYFHRFFSWNECFNSSSALCFTTWQIMQKIWLV